MTDDALTSHAIKQKYAEAIFKSDTFEPRGASRQAALDYLNTDDGALYYWRVAESAAPGTPPDEIVTRAIGQLRTGLELPRMETIGTDEVLVKFVAEGLDPSAHSPFWIRESEAKAAEDAGRNISEFFALPIKSEAPRYGMYRITPRFPTQVFITTVASTSELDGLVTKSGGAEQALVPNRQLFNGPVLVRLVDNTPSIATDVERGVSRNAVHGLTALGAAAVVYDAITTASRTADLRSHGNHVGAESEIMHFGGRNLGALGGAVLGAQVLGTAGIESGPMDVLVAGAGAIGGAIGGEKLVEAYDRHRIYQQTDPQNAAWTYDPDRPQEGWTRQVPTAETSNPPTSLLGYGALPVPVMRTIRADPALADRLSFQASSVAVELALAHPPRPRDPYSQPASPQDTPSHVDAPWKRDAQTQQWSRVVTDRMLEHGMAATHIEHASAARAAQLDEAARQTIEANLAGSRRGIAERYRAAYDQRGWAQYGDLPEAVSHALHEARDTLRASDGHQALRPFSHPDHPQHALFNKLHGMFPAGTSDERLHQATAACYKAGIRQPEHLSAMGTSDGAIHFGSSRLGGGYGRMDIINPPPTIAQTMQDVQHYDLQQVQWTGQMQAQQAQLSRQAPQGPMPGG
jgi:hypothetical protein